MESKILRARWDGNENPAGQPSLETQARSVRYRLIADEIIPKKRIRHIFLGHHQDDQVETIMMRLIRNSNDSFLGRQGIPASGPIPCCEDKRFAHVKEPYEQFGHWLQSVSDKKINTRLWCKDLNYGNAVTPSRADGIQVHRPLLPFTKSGILEFCKKHNIVHVQDQTNFDPTLTTRNAIRHLRSKYSLPRALQAPSVLRLQQAAQGSMKSLVKRAEVALKLVKIEVFDLRSGRITVHLPPQFNSLCDTDPEASAYALARLISIVSPMPRDQETRLVPEKNFEEFSHSNRQTGQAQMTIQQALFEKEEAHSVSSGSPHAPDRDDTDANSNHVEDMPKSHETIWTLSRPPMRAKEIECVSMSFPPPLDWTYRWGHGIDEANVWLRVPNGYETPGQLWSQWILWDHRYWLRIRSENAADLAKISVRAYTKDDVQKVHQKLGSRWGSLQAILAEAAPGKSRFTLPVLTKNNEVLVFPTLNVLVEQASAKKWKYRPDASPALQWEVCYKVIDHPFIKTQINTIKWRNAQVKWTKPPDIEPDTGR